MTEETTILLRTFNNAMEAAMAREKLSTSGIYSLIEDEDTVGLTPQGGCALKVFLKDKERAELIISEDTVK